MRLVAGGSCPRLSLTTVRSLAQGRDGAEHQSPNEASESLHPEWHTAPALTHIREYCRAPLSTNSYT